MLRIKFSIDLKSSSEDNLFNIIPLVIVSGSPPLFDIMTAHPLLDASKLVLPKGSSHLEQATAILDFSIFLKHFYVLRILIYLNFYVQL